MSTTKDLQEVLKEAMKLLELMKKGAHEELYKKLEELIDFIMNFPQIKRNFTPSDIQDAFFEMGFNLKKNLDEITKEDLEVYVKEMFEKTYIYRFFFPARELVDFPEGFKIGYGILFSFNKLPTVIREHISSEWKFRYEKDKEYCKTLEEYKQRKEKELYLDLEVTCFGRDKAMLLATEKANNSLSVLKAVYGFAFSPLRECTYVVEERKWVGGQKLDGFAWGRHVKIPRFDELINQINEIYSKEGPNELERRVKSAIATYGMIENTTPLEIKFLLTVISMEGLLISYEERDYIGWKFREKIALLLGDSLPWLSSFLNKNPKEITEEEVSKNLVNSRIELSRRMADVYDKRSRFAHLSVEKAKTKKEITEEDFRFVSWIFGLLLGKLLDLRLTKGVDKIEKAEGNTSLNFYLEKIKFASKT